MSPSSGNSTFSPSRVLRAAFALCVLAFGYVIHTMALARSEAAREILAKERLRHDTLDALPAARYAKFVTRGFARYFPAASTVVVVLPKGGSTAVLQWLHIGLTGAKHSPLGLHAIKKEAWNGELKPLPILNESQRIHVLASPSVLRVAVWRAPYSRLLSAWKSKFACDSYLYGGDVHGRMLLAPKLRSTAGLPPGDCLNLTEFGDALEAIGAGLRDGSLGLQDVDNHLRPVDFLGDLVHYDVVVNMEDLSDGKKLRPLVKRMKFSERMQEGVKQRHATTKVELPVTAETRKKIEGFANLSGPRPVPVGR